ncbi:MAG: glutathione S-transferase [Alphaproteobacteria bacterium]|jgi:glutathione S-transferase|nr:glutathione S-transferase [Alphaproteobacteria bacterium]
MSLTLHFHPLSSFCHKALIALYENDIPFERRIVNLEDPADASIFKKLWPVGQFPVLRDNAKNRTIPESSIIIEYLDQDYPGRTRFVPADPNLALQVRLKDRFYDLHVQVPMQKVVGDRLRAEGRKDPHGVEQATARLQVALDMIDAEMAGKSWAVGNIFTMADCAAAPALFYADKVIPLGDKHKNAAGYLRRLLDRPSYARIIEEAKPYFAMFPGNRV